MLCERFLCVRDLCVGVQTRDLYLGIECMVVTVQVLEVFPLPSIRGRLDTIFDVLPICNLGRKAGVENNTSTKRYTAFQVNAI